MLDWRTWMYSLALWCGATYVLCVVWCGIAPEAWSVRPLLEMVFPGFTWLTFPSFVLGLVESVLFGAYAGALFAGLHNAVFRVRSRTAHEKLEEAHVVA